MRKTRALICLGFWLVLELPATALALQEPSADDARLEVVPGPINSAVVRSGDRWLSVYRTPDSEGGNADWLLLTHHRRDVVEVTRAAIDQGTPAVAPAAERDLIATPEAFWSRFVDARFSDTAQQSTKILDRPLAVERWVDGGDVIRWQGLEIQVLATPGFTRGAVSYLAEIGGQRVVFTGDLIYQGGRLLDLYSFQDAIPDAQVGGYHGYGGRLADLVASLRAVADARPDLIVPARGPVIEQPRREIEELILRVQQLYHNYLSTNALNWYFKEDRMRICGERVLGEGATIELMPYAEHVRSPEWIWEHVTSRMIISDTGAGLLLDCWNQGIIDAVQELIDRGTIDRVEAIFVTHYHDDHTAMVQAAAEQFDCPVYATDEYADILERPGAYHMPAMLRNAIHDVRAVPDGHTMRWHEFDLTFRYYPGQAIYHGALWVKRDGEQPIFFVGDSFAPSGIDDYCVLNRNLVHEDAGYLRCLRILRDAPRPYWIVNQHIPYVFRFTDEELDYLESRYRQRIALLGELFPWDDPNYGIDEQWAVFYPYGVDCQAGEEIDLAVRIVNHSPVTRTFQVTPRLAEGMELVSGEEAVTLRSREWGAVHLRVRVPPAEGVYLVRSDVRSEGMEFLDFVEAMIIVN